MIVVAASSPTMTWSGAKDLLTIGASSSAFGATVSCALAPGAVCAFALVTGPVELAPVALPTTLATTVHEPPAGMIPLLKGSADTEGMPSPPQVLLTTTPQGGKLMPAASAFTKCAPTIDLAGFPL